MFWLLLLFLCTIQSCFFVCNCSLLSSLRTMWVSRPSTRLLVRAVWSVSTLSWFRERKLSKSCDQICVFISFPLYYPTSQLHLCKGPPPNSKQEQWWYLNAVSTVLQVRESEDLWINFTGLNIGLNKLSICETCKDKNLEFYIFDTMAVLHIPSQKESALLNANFTLNHISLYIMHNSGGEIDYNFSITFKISAELVFLNIPTIRHYLVLLMCVHFWC